MVITTEKMKPWKPIKGDDAPFRTIALRDCPIGFHFDEIEPDVNLDCTIEYWSELIEYAERFYSDYEIVGITFVDWLNGLQLNYDKNKYKLETVLSNIDKIKLDMGSSTIRSKSGSDTLTSSGSDTRTNEQNNLGTSKNIDLAFDSANESPTSKTVDDGVSTIDETIEYGRGENRTNTETETINVNRFNGEFSIELYNKLIENYPNIFDIFVSFFKNNFSLQEGLYW